MSEFGTLAPEATDWTGLRLTYSQTVSVLRDIVREAGEGYTYEQPEVPLCDGSGETAPIGCVYVHNGKASCLIGQMFGRVFGSAFLTALVDAGMNEMTGAHDVLDRFHIDADGNVRTLVRVVQGWQDKHNTWTSSLEAGESAVADTANGNIYAEDTWLQMAGTE